MKGLLTLKQLSVEKILELIHFAEDLKKGCRLSYPNKKVATLFFENSTRTHYSFQCAILNLEAKILDFDAKVSSVSKGESLYDTVKTLEAIGVDAVVIRHQEDEYFKKLEGINIPILNGGDGKSNHPTQSLLDLMTIHEEFGKFEGLKICIVGDIAHSRVAHTNIEIMRRLGMEVYISGPEEFNDNSAEWISFDEAIEKMDIIMMLRVQFERHQEKMKMSIEEYHKKYGMTEERMNKMKEHAIIMHPAPINRGVEIASNCAEAPKSRIFAQMTNGVYIRMAVISQALDGKLSC